MRANGWRGAAGQEGPHHDRRPGRGPGAGPGGPPVPGAGAEPAAGGRLHLRPAGRPAGSSTPRSSIDAYAGRIVGWECSASKHTASSSPRSARPQRSGHAKATPFDRGDPSLATPDRSTPRVHFGETLMLDGLTPSVGTVGDAFDNALAETTIGLYKTECIRADSPFRRGPLRPSADLETDHRRLGRTGTTRAGSCTASADPTRRSRSRLLCTNP